MGGAAAGLFAVLAAMAGAALLLRAVAARRGWLRPGGRLRMEVVQRLALGPRQGLAVVRIGDRLLAVSLGDGGVRPVLELGDAELAALAGAPAPLPALPPAAADFAARLRAALRTAALVLLLAGAAAPSAAQGAPAERPAAAAVAGTVAARADSAFAGAPRLALAVGEGDGGLKLSGTVGVVVMMGLLSMIPALVLMMTGFTRILIVLHFVRQALGTQTAPPAHLIGAMALLLTGFVMGPTLQEVDRTALQPWLDGRITEARMLEVGQQPFREFMLRQTREADVALFLEMSRTPAPASVREVPLVVLASAFVTSELRTAFQMGFVLFLPFIVIDVVVSAVLMSMGMMMLPPAMISLPFKLLLFVLVDGWALVVQGLVNSFR
jgi:flagellar biosynthetic protein FliP